jgi:chromosome segregation ATPase
LCRIATRLKR